MYAIQTIGNHYPAYLNLPVAGYFTNLKQKKAEMFVKHENIDWLLKLCFYTLWKKTYTYYFDESDRRNSKT